MKVWLWLFDLTANYIIPQKFPKSPKTFKIPKSALLGDEIPKVGQPAVTKPIVFSLFQAFLILSDLCYPHDPPSEGYTVQIWKTGFLYLLGDTYIRHKYPNQDRVKQLHQNWNLLHTIFWILSIPVYSFPPPKKKNLKN